MLSAIALLLTTLAIFTLLTKAATYPTLRYYHGSTFLDGFNFVADWDNTTSGDVFWKNHSSLAYFDPIRQATIIQVDNSTELAYNEKRDSVKVYSNDWFKPGVLMIMDVVHLPTGCSTWPAWWLYGEDWPSNGEIDIIETINTQSFNQFSLHTGGPCIATPNPSVGMTGTYSSTECDVAIDYGKGCVTNASSGSTGEAFNQAGGGVYAVEFATSGINFWFVPRSSIPESLRSGMSSLDSTILGTPTASYSALSCDINRYFGPQKMVIDTTLCGVWAGQNLGDSCAIPNPTPENGTCYSYYVAGPPSNFDNAYWEIKYLQVFGDASAIDAGLSMPSPSSITSSSSLTPLSPPDTIKTTTSPSFESLPRTSQPATSTTTAGGISTSSVPISCAPLRRTNSFVAGALVLFGVVAALAM